MSKPDRDVEAFGDCLGELEGFPQFLRSAGLGISPSDLERAPKCGGFSLVEHACHLRDYEEAGCLQRILRMLVEESPCVKDFEGERIAVERSYRHQSFSAAVEDFAYHRQTTLRILTSLSPEDWQRTATLESIGRISIRQLAEIVAAHDKTHLHEIENLLGEIRSEARSAAEHAQDVAALHEMAREFTEGFNTGDLDRIMRFYGSSYVDVNLRVPLQSYEERRAYFSQMMSRGEFRLQVYPDEIALYGAIAFVRGRVEIIDRDTAAVRELRYLEISRKEADGWKAIWGIDGPVNEF